MTKRQTVKRTRGITPTKRATARSTAAARVTSPSFDLGGTWILTYNQLLAGVEPGAEATFLNDGAWGPLRPAIDRLHKHECTFTRLASGEFVSTPIPMVGYPGGPSSEAALGTLHARIVTRHVVRTRTKPAASFSVLTMMQESPGYCSAWAGSRVYREGPTKDIPVNEFRGYWRDQWYPSDIVRAGYFKLTRAGL